MYVGRDKRTKPYMVNDVTRLKAVLRHHALMHVLDPMALGIIYEGRLLNSERTCHHYGLEQGSCIRIVRLTGRDRNRTPWCEEADNPIKGSRGKKEMRT